MTVKGGGPLGEERMREIATGALKARADAVHVLIFHSWGGLTRFASSQIHQNTWREDLEIRVMAVADGARIGVAATHSLDPAAVAKATEDALAVARVSPPNPEFPGLAPPASAPAKSGFDAATASTSPAERADYVARALAEFQADMTGAGYVESVADEVLVTNSLGLSMFGATTHAGLSVMAMTGDSSGVAEIIEPRLSAIDPVAIAQRAVSKADRGRNPQPIDAGRYTVVLEPAASSTLMQFMGYLGFGAKAFLEERSFMSGKIGERLCSDLITIVDDPLGAESLGLPFDFEGTPAQRVTLIDRGTARDVVWDRTTAQKVKRDSTGHGLPPPNSSGPFPLNLRMEPGSSSLDELIASTERGLLITRFHYSNVVNEKEAVLTGMTRDGTFLIENGTLKHGVNNLRYTQNAIEALSNVEGVGDSTEISSELFFGGSRAPALKIHDFNFSSATTH
ncbi:MAG: TldD/PmbA family protein [Actinomycetota bacterium]